MRKSITFILLLLDVAVSIGSSIKGLSRRNG